MRDAHCDRGVGRRRVAMHRQGGRGSGYRGAGLGQAYYHDNGSHPTVAAAAAYASWRGGNYMPGILRAPVHLQQQHHYPQHQYHQQQHVQGYQGHYQGQSGHGGRGGGRHSGQGRQHALGVQGAGAFKRSAGANSGHGFHGRGRGKGWGGRNKKNLTKEALDADLDQWRLKDKKFGATSLDADLDDYWKNRKDDSTQNVDDKETDAYLEEEEAVTRKDSGDRKANGVGIARGSERHIMRGRDTGEKAKRAVASCD